MVDSGRNHLSLSWGKPIRTNAAPVTAYRVEAWQLSPDGGARWTELGMAPINRFDVFNLKMGSQYHFRVTPRNRYGWARSVQTTSPITVGCAECMPEFTSNLPGQSKALIGRDFSLDCVVSGVPRPNIIWYKDAVPIHDMSGRVTTKFYGNNLCRLEICNLQKCDSGRYVCEATNLQGRVSTFARLQAVADYRIFDAENRLKAKANDEFSTTEEFLPQFTMRLRDRRVQESYPIRLTCQAIGWPTPTITWHKDSNEITANGLSELFSHFKMEFFIELLF